MPRSPIIGVMGGGVASPHDLENAYLLGSLIAQNGWVLLNGGRRAGIMEASAKGAKSQGGLTVGILPDESSLGTSEFIDIPVLTGMGNARNCINVLSSHVVVACPGGAGTLSEIALALKVRRPVILLNFTSGKAFDSYTEQGLLHQAKTPEEVVELIKTLLKRGQV